MLSRGCYPPFHPFMRPAPFSLRFSILFVNGHLAFSRCYLTSHISIVVLSSAVLCCFLCLLQHLPSALPQNLGCPPLRACTRVFCFCCTILWHVYCTYFILS